MNEKKLNDQAIPTLDEIQKLYEGFLREEASQINEESQVESGEFFKNFRKYENKDRITSEDNQIIKKYEDYLKVERKKQKELIEELENLIDYESFFLEIERNYNKKNYKGNFYGSNPATRYRINKINEYSRKLEEIIKSL